MWGVSFYLYSLYSAVMRLRRVTSIVIALMLGGCMAFKPAEPSQSPPSPGQTNSAPPEQQAALPPLPVPPPAERPLEPQKLVGLTQEQIKQLIGTPAAVREQSPAVVWSYDSAGCGLQLFFYLDMTSELYKALTYELKPKKPGGLQGSACLASLRPPTPTPGSPDHE